LSDLLEEPGGSTAVVDVREPREFAVAHLAAAVNIPVGELHSRMGSLPKGRVVFVCRSGVRSLTAAALASRAGVEDIAHLEGGLLAWGRDVDPTFEVAPV
jgi:sulfur-carrier protein adenylyltransferase/sulfurtransferase